VLARDLPRITAPLLVFHSEEDHVVDDATVPLIAERVSSTDLVEQTLRKPRGWRRLLVGTWRPQDWSQYTCDCTACKTWAESNPPSTDPEITRIVWPFCSSRATRPGTATLSSPCTGNAPAPRMS